MTIAKPIRKFIAVLGVVDLGEAGIRATVIGYDGSRDTIAHTSRVVSDFEKDEGGNIVRFETLNSVYVRDEE